MKNATLFIFFLCINTIIFSSQISLIDIPDDVLKNKILIYSKFSSLLPLVCKKMNELSSAQALFNFYTTQGNLNVNYENLIDSEKENLIKRMAYSSYANNCEKFSRELYFRSWAMNNRDTLPSDLIENIEKPEIIVTADMMVFLNWVYGGTLVLDTLTKQGTYKKAKNIYMSFNTCDDNRVDGKYQQQNLDNLLTDITLCEKINARDLISHLQIYCFCDNVKALSYLCNQVKDKKIEVDFSCLNMITHRDKQTLLCRWFPGIVTQNDFKSENQEIWYTGKSDVVIRYNLNMLYRGLLKIAMQQSNFEVFNELLSQDPFRLNDYKDPQVQWVTRSKDDVEKYKKDFEISEARDYGNIYFIPFKNCSLKTYISLCTIMFPEWKKDYFRAIAYNNLYSWEKFTRELGGSRKRIVPKKNFDKRSHIFDWDKFEKYAQEIESNVKKHNDSLYVEFM